MAKAGRKRMPGTREPNGRIQRASSASAGRSGVYVMRSEGSGYLKIGVSNSPARRAAAIQTASPHGVSVAFFIELRREEAQRLETECHKRLRGTAHHVRGEWYCLRPSVAACFVMNVAAELGLSQAGGRAQ